MKTSLYKRFKEELLKADNNAPIWCAGFHFLALTEGQAQDLRVTFLDRYGDNSGVVHFPNGVSIKP